MTRPIIPGQAVGPMLPSQPATGARDDALQKGGNLERFVLDVVGRSPEAKKLRRFHSSGSHGAGHWYAPAIQPTVNAGWAWAEHGALPPDADYFKIVTPGGTPGGVAAAGSSGIQVLKDGVYRVYASTLQYFAAGVAGRVDTYLNILTSAGVVVTMMDASLTYAPTTTIFMKATLGFEAVMTAGQIVWPQNVHGQAYGDVGGGFSNLSLRYLGA